MRKYLQLFDEIKLRILIFSLLGLLLGLMFIVFNGAKYEVTSKVSIPRFNGTPIFSGDLYLEKLRSPQFYNSISKDLGPSLKIQDVEKIVKSALSSASYDRGGYSLVLKVRGGDANLLVNISEQISMSIISEMNSIYDFKVSNIRSKISNIKNNLIILERVTKDPSIIKNSTDTSNIGAFFLPSIYSNAYHMQSSLYDYQAILSEDLSSPSELVQNPLLNKKLYIINIILKLSFFVLLSIFLCLISCYNKIKFYLI